MKKQLAAMIFGAALVMSVPAAADVSVTQVGSLQGVEWITGSNLLKMGEYGASCVADTEGNALTEAKYSSLYYDNGYITARDASDDVNSTGLLSIDGTEIIPCTYGDIRVSNEHWAVAFKLKEADANNYDYESWFSSEDKYYLIETADVYHLTGDGAALGGSFTRENYKDADAEGDYIKIENRADGSVTCYDGSFNVVAEDLRSIYDEVDQEEYEIFSENGQEGIKDRDGNVLVSPAFEYIYDVMEDGYARVSTGDKDGLIDLSGNVVVPAQYDDLKRNYYGRDGYDGFVAAGYVAAERDGKAAYCDLNGNETMEAKYAADVVEFNGASATLTDLEGNVHILAADGVDTVLDGAHKDARALYYSDGLLYTFTNENYEYGLMDWHGKEIFPAQYNDLSLSGDGTMLLVDIDYENAELYTVDYGMTGASPAQTGEAAPGEAPVETEAAPEEAPAEAQAAPEEAPAESEAGATPLGSLIDSIITLVNTDFETNKDAVTSLIDTAAGMLTEQQGNIRTVLETVSSLVSSGLGDAASVVALLESARSLIG